MATQIAFGTDGWRAQIADDYTFDNLRELSQALAVYLCKYQPDKSKIGVAIGYDTRFRSADFARLVADTIAGAGIPVFLSDRDAPTPAIAWATRSMGLATGIIITASHNAPIYNGFKFFNPLGGPADKDATNAVEFVLGKKPSSNTGAASVQTFDPRPAHFEQLRKVVDFDRLKSVKGIAVCDPVYGAGRGYVDALLKECGWEVHLIRNVPDPMFGGILPDPANPKCHQALCDAVKEHGANIGLANDPDADRFGIVDSTGEYLTPNQILPILYFHLLEVRGMRGPVARSLPTTGMLDAIAKAYGQEVIETPVGFKWVGAAIEDEGAILGGEESGGLSIAGHYGGKDGVLADLLLAEVWATHQKPLGELLRELEARFGEFHSTRTDLHIEDEPKRALMDKMKTTPPLELAGQKVVKVVSSDGVKLTLADGSWVLLRASGTEPLVRIYSEAGSPEKLQVLSDAATKLAE